MKFTSVGAVLSSVNTFPVKYDVFPARSVAIILTLANVLSTIGNVRSYDPSLFVPVLMTECNVVHPSLEYCNTNPVVQKFISDPVVQVIVLVVPPWK